MDPNHSFLQSKYSLDKKLWTRLGDRSVLYFPYDTHLMLRCTSCRYIFDYVLEPKSKLQPNDWSCTQCGAEPPTRWDFKFNSWE